MEAEENKEAMEQVMSKIWSIFDILNKSGQVSSVIEQAEIVLLLLTLYKEGEDLTDLFERSNTVNEPIEPYGNTGYNKQSRNSYQAVLKTHENDIFKINNKTIKQITNKLIQLDNNFLSNNFYIIFDSVLNQICKSKGRDAGEFTLPVELSRFICQLADLPANAKVFNPFAGVASFAVSLNQSQEYIGLESNSYIATLGALRIMAYGREANSTLDCKNPIEDWPSEEQKFDLIVSAPPHNMRLTNLKSNIKTAEHFLILKGVKSLNQDGKLIAVLSQRFLFSGGQERLIREQLILDDLIDTVINLPSGLQSNTSVGIIVLVINKSKMHPNKVRFVNAEKFTEGQNTSGKTLNREALIEYLNNTNEDSEYIKYIDNDQIKSENYNLNVPLYFQKKQEGISLGDILEYIQGQKQNLPETGKLIRLRDLKDDKIDFKLTDYNLEDTALIRPDICKIEDSCLLLAVRWMSLKPTYFEHSGNSVFRSQDILSFKINEEIADKAYLINELHADYVLEQLNAYRMGNAINASIRKEDLLKIVVKLPSIEEQRAKVQGLIELSHKIKTLQDERDILAHGSSEKQFNEFASLKHTLGRPRQNILSWTRNMIRFFESNKEALEALDIEFTEFYEKGIVEALKEIKSDINFITNVLEKGEHGLMLNNYELTYISLEDINDVVNYLSNNGFNFKIRKLLAAGGSIKEKGIRGNIMLIKTLFDNLLTNANKHGFDNNLPSNEFVIELTEIGENLILEVKNNGKPFPKNFNREKFITKYSTRDTINGSGLGGYDIQRIADYLGNPDWELILNNDPFYPVKFRFIFPIKLIE